MSKLRLALIADGRSENFRRWVRFFFEQGDDIHILSTYRCETLAFTKLCVLHGFARASNMLVKNSNAATQPPIRERSISLSQRVLLRKWGLQLYDLWNNIKILNVLTQTISARRILQKVQPDAVVAFRTQNEGYIAAFADYHPWILFTQGSDLFYMANRQPLQRWLSRQALVSTDGLMADCRRDVMLATRLGLHVRRPTGIFPGNGGVDLSIYRFGQPAEQRERLVVYPRGLAPYLRLDTLMKSVRLLQQQAWSLGMRYVLLTQPATIRVIEIMARQHGIDRGRIDILPFMSQDSFAALLQRAAVMVSPSVTDGIPNSMLEAMACGAFPIMSNLESIREWIEHGVNGLLFDPESPDSLAGCIQEAIENSAMREKAQKINVELVRERADYQKVMPEVREFCRRIVAQSRMA